MICKTIAFALILAIAFSIRSTDKVNAPPVFFFYYSGNVISNNVFWIFKDSSGWKINTLSFRVSIINPYN